MQVTWVLPRQPWRTMSSRPSHCAPKYGSAANWASVTSSHYKLYLIWSLLCHIAALYSEAWEQTLPARSQMAAHCLQRLQIKCSEVTFWRFKEVDYVLKPGQEKAQQTLLLFSSHAIHLMLNLLHNTPAVPLLFVLLQIYCLSYSTIWNISLDKCLGKMSGYLKKDSV